MFNIGFSEMLIIAAMVLIFIGPKELPQIARTIGRFLNELRRASDGLKKEFTSAINTEPQKSAEIKPPQVVKEENGESENDRNPQS